MSAAPASGVLRLAGRVVFRALQAAILVFCLAPPILVFVLSFYRDVFENFPPHDLTLDLYRQVIEDPRWREAIVYTFRLAVPTAVLTILLVAPAALALERARVRGKAVLEFSALLPMLMPSTGYAVALYILYLRLGWTERYLPLVLAEAIVSTPVAFLILRSALRRLPRHLDFAAMSLGASRARALWDVSFSLMRPAMLAGALFSLVHVFDDALYVTFLGGASTETVSKAIFDSIEFTLEPAVAALSAGFTIITTFLTMSAVAVRRLAGA